MASVPEAIVISRVTTVTADGGRDRGAAAADRRRRRRHTGDAAAAASTPLLPSLPSWGRRRARNDTGVVVPGTLSLMILTLLSTTAAFSFPPPSPSSSSRSSAFRPTTTATATISIDANRWRFNPYPRLSKSSRESTSAKVGDDVETNAMVEICTAGDAAPVTTKTTLARSFRRSTDGDDDDSDDSAASTGSLAVESDRRMFLAATLATVGTVLAPLPPSASSPFPPFLPPFLFTPPASASELFYQPSPVNKRSGVTVYDAERVGGYTVSFVAYLSRFLLVFDGDSQKWWYERASDIPQRSDRERVEQFRLRQFGQFAASVEVGLQDYEGGDGPAKLFSQLVERYGDGGSGDIGGSGEAEREARRQIALLFGLLGPTQPVESITRLLDALDDASVPCVVVEDPGAGYAPDADPPAVLFPPPLAGKELGGSAARGRAVMKETGRILRIDVANGGEGYFKPPAVEISPPAAAAPSASSGSTATAAVPARAKAILGKSSSTNEGRSVERIEILDGGSGYAPNEAITVSLSSPAVPTSPSPFKGKGWLSSVATATARAVPELRVASVEVIDGGSKYAAEQPIRVLIDPPTPPPVVATAAATAGGIGVGTGSKDSTAKVLVATARAATATAYPRGKATSYESFRRRRGGAGGGSLAAAAERAGSSAASIGLPFSTGPTSSELVSLLPSGYGLRFDSTLKRYVLSSSENFDVGFKSLEGRTFKPVDPDFGPRGRSPIERDRKLEGTTVLRFMASGAICSSVAHLVLTPIDVVKTKCQTDPGRYTKSGNGGLGGIAEAFGVVLKEEGAATLFDGWVPTFAGYFFAGGTIFFFTEVFRRYFSALVGTVNAATYEIPLVVAGAACAATICIFVLAPFDAVRIRMVSQPEYGNNIVGTTARMVKEEGATSLFSSIPVLFLKEVPFNMMKFLVFDLTTERLYEMYPVAREDIKLSLAVSLIGGTLAGIAGAVVSQPADTLVSEMKKAKTDMTVQDAVRQLNERGGVPAFYTGLTLRVIFISLLVSLQFFFYDAVRISLEVGTDDMKLYLNVLDAALRK